MLPELIDVIATDPAPLAWFASPGGAVEHYSPPLLEYLGLTAREVRGWNWQWAVHPADLRRVSRAWAHSVRTGQPFQAECRLRRADGAYLWHAGTASLRRGADGPGQWHGIWVSLEDTDRSPAAAHAGAEAELALC